MLRTASLHSRMSETDLGLQIAVDVAELVKFSDSAKHLRDVEPRVLLLEDARVVEECPEVSAGDKVL